MARSWRDAFELGEPRRRRPRADDPGDQPTEPEPGGGLFRRLRQSLSKSRERSQAELGASLFDQLDDEAWERMEEALILADVGARTTAEVVGRLEAEVEGGTLSGADAVRERLVELLAEAAGGDDARIDLRARPAVIMVVGVNGTGKTTTIGKLAWHVRRRARPLGDRGGRRHLPRRRNRAARAVGRARRGRDRSRQPGR